MKKSKITLVNIIANIVLQIVNIITNFIIPKLILSYFGSEVNGLVSSITQFLSYISLVEGGITGVVTAKLYKPLIDNDYDKISSIIKTSDKFYKKIGLIFIIYSLVLSIIYPLLFNANFSFGYIFSLVLILSINLLIQYMYSLSLKNLLNADKKCYIVSFTQSLVLMLGVILGYLSIKIYPSIHILKIITGLLFIIQPIVYSKFINKNYNIINSAKEDKELLKERWNGFAISVAAFIHNSTDIALLTIFTDLLSVSIYSVYSIVTMGLKSVFNAISNAIVPVIGKAYASGNNKEINSKMDLYEFITFNLVFFMFTLASLLITPFVMIYTKDIADANYNQLLFGILLVISEALYLIKFPHLNLSYSANKFKELTMPAFIEAGINLIVSLILINKFGLIGVAVGTICGMIYRMIYQVKFTSIIIDRNQKIFYKKLLTFSIFTIIGLVISYYCIPLTQYDLLHWIINAILYSIVFGLIYLINDILFYKNEVKELFNYLGRR